MEANNSFDKIINTWRHLSGERTETSVISMSGDSQTYKKKEEEDHLLMPDKTKASVAINVNSTVAVADASQDTSLDKLDEIPGHKSHETENATETIGDTDDNSKSDIGHSDPDEIINNSSNVKQEDDGDKVDSVYLRPSPAVKTRSTASVKEEEDNCGINCLYYTLECCNCAIM